MQSSLQQDLQRLAELAYHRLEWCGDLVREQHRLRKVAREHPDLDLLEKIGVWLFVPFTLWAIDFPDICEVVQQRVAAGERLEDELRLLIDSLPPLPSEKARSVAALREHEVQRGNYEVQVRAGEKDSLMEQRLMKDRAFRDQWSAIKAQFDVAAFRDSKGIIRRRMVAERGFRPEWQLNWIEPASRFRAVFDLFCHRWDLYGMIRDRPLLMKLTVNLTPHGTMIVIPAWWSFDHTRDLNWKEVKRLHNARVPSKQGPKLTRNQIEQDAETRRAALLNAEAKASGLKGARREAWVMERLGWNGGDPRKLRRVLNRAARL